MQKNSRIICAVPFVIKGRDYTPEAGTIRAVIPNGATKINSYAFSDCPQPDKTVVATSTPDNKAIRQCFAFFILVFSSFFPDKIINSIIGKQLQPVFQNIIQLIHIQRFRDMSIHACIFCQLYIFCKSICCHGNNR